MHFGSWLSLSYFCHPVFLSHPVMHQTNLVAATRLRESIISGWLFVCCSFYCFPCAQSAQQCPFSGTLRQRIRMGKGSFFAFSLRALTVIPLVSRPCLCFPHPPTKDAYKREKVCKIHWQHPANPDSSTAIDLWSLLMPAPLPCNLSRHLPPFLFSGLFARLAQSSD